MSDHLLLRALRGESTSRVPVWLMRQAGRYLPEYRAVRAEHEFLEVVKTPELACEVSLQPIRRFDLDGVILFSDILTPLEGMGIPFTLDEGGPRILQPVNTAADVAKVVVADPTESTPYVLDLIRMLNRELAGRVPVLGFAGAPYTLANYSVGDGRRGKASAVKTLAYTEPKTLHALLDKLADQAASYLLAQVEAGVAAVQLFDTWAGELGAGDYREFALPYQQKVIAAVRPRAPVILYVHGAVDPQLLAASDADVLSVDWRTPLAAARAGAGRDVVLQGNLDPAVLLGPAEVVRARTRAVLADGGGRGHVFNLGHGLLPPTPPDNVAVLVDTVKARRPEP